MKEYVDKALEEEEAEKAAAAEAGEKKDGSVDAEVVAVSGLPTALEVSSARCLA